MKNQGNEIIELAKKHGASGYSFSPTFGFTPEGLIAFVQQCLASEVQGAWQAGLDEGRAQKTAQHCLYQISEPEVGNKLAIKLAEKPANKCFSLAYSREKVGNSTLAQASVDAPVAVGGEREAFEQAYAAHAIEYAGINDTQEAVQQRLNESRRDSNSYEHLHDDGAWVGWQLARAALAATPKAPTKAITASIMRDDGGESPAYCLMVAYRSETEATSALSLLTATQAATVEHLDMDRVLSIADVHAEESREDGVRLMDRGGLVAFASDVLRAATPAAAAPVVLPEPVAAIKEVMGQVKELRVLAVGHGILTAGISTASDKSIEDSAELLRELESEIDAKLSALLAGVLAPAAVVEPSDFPAGAIHSGRVYADRLEDYGFECEAGGLSLCSDWQEFRRCFEFLAELASLHSPQAQADSWDEALLKFLQNQCIDLRCFTTSYGEDVGWRTVQHHMDEPRERVVSEVYSDQPRRAIREAMARIARDPYCTGPLHLEDDAAIAAQAAKED